MELIDLLNTSGTPTGLHKPKSDVHRDGDWHRAAHLWIVASDGRVLLQKRALAKENWPGKWDVSVAGHVAAGESAVDAAIREAREELGLVIDARELRHIGTIRERCVLNEGTYIDNEIHEVFVMRRDVDLATLTLDASEVERVALVPAGELESWDVVPHAEEYAMLRSSL